MISCANIDIIFDMTKFFLKNNVHTRKIIDSKYLKFLVKKVAEMLA